MVSPVPGLALCREAMATPLERGTRMGAHDAAFYWIGNKYPERLACDLLGLARARIELLPRELPHFKRQADFAVIVRWPRPSRVLHVEHVKGRADLPRIVQRHALYHAATGLSVETCVVQTSRKTARPIPAVYRFGVGRRMTCVPLRRVRLWRFRAEEVLRSGRIELYAFVAFMRTRLTARALLEETRRRIIALVVDEGDRAELIAMLASLSAEELGAAVVERTLGRIADMRRTSWYEQIADVGRAEGLEKGLEKGLKRGIEKGLREGLRRGELAAMRKSLLAVLRARFRRVPEALRSRLDRVKAPGKLDRLLCFAATAASLEAFADGLTNGRKSAR